MGAGIKLLAGMFSLWLKNRRDERDERINLADKQIKAAREARSVDDSYFRHTRRVLAWGVCFTFCVICIVWAFFPGYPILKDIGERGTEINFLLFHWTFSGDLGGTRTTGSIVWELIPFMSMILMTYFTPDISKI